MMTNFDMQATEHIRPILEILYFYENVLFSISAAFYFFPFFCILALSRRDERLMRYRSSGILGLRKKNFFFGPVENCEQAKFLY